VVKGLSPYPEGQALTREEIRVSIGIRERRRGQRVFRYPLKRAGFVYQRLRESLYAEGQAFDHESSLAAALCTQKDKPLTTNLLDFSNPIRQFCV